MAKITDPKNQKCQEAIQLKYEGTTYAVIAKKIGVSLITIKRWFMSDGLLKDEYEQYREERNQFSREVANEVIKKNVTTAAGILIGLMGSDKDEIKLKSALAILEYVFGKPTQTIKQDSPPMIYESIIRKIEEEKEEEELAKKQE